MVKMKTKVKTQWGQQIGLKHDYTNPNEGKVKKYKMSKKELEEYLKELELKNKWKLGGRK